MPRVRAGADAPYPAGKCASALDLQGRIVIKNQEGGIAHDF
jgi:hypothetical protein